MFAEEPLWINRNEYSTASRQYVAFGVHDLRNVEMAAAVHAQFSGVHAQRLVERNWLQIIDRHLRGHGGDLAELVQLPHSVIENCGDDSAVAVSGRPGVALAKTKLAGKAPPLRIMHELQTHALRIIFSAGKTKVLCGFWFRGCGGFPGHTSRYFKAGPSTPLRCGRDDKFVRGAGISSWLPLVRLHVRQRFQIASGEDLFEFIQHGFVYEVVRSYGFTAV